MCDNTILGYGASGKVELTRHFGILVAKKRMLTNGSNGTTRASAIAESMLLMNLDHPHIVRVYAFHVYPCEVVLEMEYAGTELFRIVETLPDPRGVHKQVCDAVAYLHDLRIAHRDLKLENVVLDATGHARLIDFGFARHFGLTQLSTDRLGSVSYCAPEIWTPQPYNVFSADVWALGVLLFALAHRYYFPFLKAWGEDAHFQACRHAQLEEGKTPSEALCAALPNITFVEWARAGLDKALRIRPHERATARALLEEA